MATLKCKMCGGDVPAQEGATFGTCDSCGSASTLPKASDERVANLFNRANHLRQLGEFDKALSAYENILTEDAANAEAHWGAVLCRYGIEYVEDTKTHKRVPTCHRAQFESILTDADYLSALEHSPDSYTKELYETEAKKISVIQKIILDISSKEEPFDVFICYKEATDGGSRTKDSTLAQDIYYQLTNDGMRVFFSRINLEDKLGQQYEPYIFSALSTAKIMLVVGTKPEHFNAVWVKNEWSRFLSLAKKDRNRLLIPCYRDMDAYDLPDEFTNLQAQDMGKIGFVQDLVRNIKKVLEASNLALEKPAKSAESPVVVPHIFSDLAVQERVREQTKNLAELEGFKRDLEMQLENERHKLRDYQDRARAVDADAQRRKRDAEYSRDSLQVMTIEMFAHVNPWKNEVEESQKFIASLQENISKVNRELLPSAISAVNHWEAIMRQSPIERVEDYYQTTLKKMKNISDEKEMAELGKQFRMLGGYKDSAKHADECESKSSKIQYDKLVANMTRASTEAEYKDLAGQFRSMKKYNNAYALAAECEKRLQKLKARREEQERIDQEQRQKQERIEREQRELQEKEEQKERERRAADAEKSRNALKAKRYIGNLLLVGLMALYLYQLVGTNWFYENVMDSSGTVRGGTIGGTFLDMFEPTSIVARIHALMLPATIALALFGIVVGVFSIIFKITRKNIIFITLLVQIVVVSMWFHQWWARGHIFAAILQSSLAIIPGIILTVKGER